MVKIKVATYNIQYGSGIKSFSDYFNLFKFFKQDGNAIAQIGEILKKQDLDIVGLIEIDNGSWRTNGVSQIKKIAEILSLPFIFNECKYSEFAKNLPILRDQHHALLSRYPLPDSFIYRFKSGFKKAVLISKVKVNGKHEVTILLTHLSLSKSTRSRQLHELSSLIRNIQTPIILMGDFNAAPNSGEIQEFAESSDLEFVSHSATFPSWAPTKSYDHVFVSKDIGAKKSLVLPQKLSDHLPLIVELEVPSKVSISAPKMKKMLEAL